MLIPMIGYYYHIWPVSHCTAWFSSVPLHRALSGNHHSWREKKLYSWIKYGENIRDWMIYLNRANACPTKSEVFSSRPNFWGILIDFCNMKQHNIHLVDLSHGCGLRVDILPGFGVILTEVLLWSQYQPGEFALDLVFTITWTKTRKFLKRRFSKRPDKLI